MSAAIGLCVSLPGRGMVKISGADGLAFAQNLFTNDLALLGIQPCLYACLLTPQGKFLHDFFITRNEGDLILECEGGARAEDLARRLERYRLRASVSIDLKTSVRVEAFLPSEGKSEVPPGFTPDPRHPDMGARAIFPDEASEATADQDFEQWDRRRILLGIPDGSRDMVPESSTLIESGLDRLHGVSFTKGCYVGQELTSRMHHRGLAKKHIVPVRCAGGVCPVSGTDIRIENRLVGQMRSSCGDLGLALIRDDALSEWKQSQSTNSRECRPLTIEL